MQSQTSLGDAEAAAYFAGLFDGEGSVSISFKKPGVRANAGWKGNHRLEVQLAMCDEGAVRAFAAFAGVGRVYEWGPRDGVRNVSWHFSANGNNAVIVLEKLRPYLRVKAAHAEIAVAFQKTISKPGPPFPVTPEVFAQREEWRSRLRSMNKKAHDRTGSVGSSPAGSQGLGDGAPY
jgi:hypothetical protein